MDVGDAPSRVSSPSRTRSSRTSASTATSAPRARSPSVAGPVVDVWGGVADRATERPWTRDTLQLVFSTTKGATAICAHLLVAARPARPRRAGRLLLARVRGERQGRHPGALGALAPRRPRRDRGHVHPRRGARVGPGRRGAGRAAAELGAGHGARLPHPLVRLARRRARAAHRRPHASVGSSPTRSPAPLGLDFWIGLPEAQEPRVAPLVPPEPATDPAAQALFEQFAGPDTFLGRTLTGPSGLFHYDEMWNTRAIARGRAAVLERHRRRRGRSPACTRRPSARSTASGCSSPRRSRPRPSSRRSGPDKVVMFPMRYGLGFMLAADARPRAGTRRVRPCRRGRLARLRRPRPRARVRLRDEPDGDGHERRRARLRASPPPCTPASTEPDRGSRTPFRRASPRTPRPS